MGNVINLKKTAGIILEKLSIADVQANIVVAIDDSGSMDDRIRSGEVQEIVDRFLGVGMNMDVDKSIDVYTFNTSPSYVGTANESNHATFVKKSGIYAHGGTNYAPIMNMILAKYGTAITPQVVTEQVNKEVEPGFFGKLLGAKSKTITETVTKTVMPGDVKPVQYPTIVFFVTDGANWDTDEARRVIVEAAKQGVFWQFIGIGEPAGGFPFLEELDNMTGRFVDNADFFEAKEILQMSDGQLYNRILQELPRWLKEAKQKGLIL